VGRKDKNGWEIYNYGFFSEKELAAKAYQDFAIINFGEFTDLVNYPKYYRIIWLILPSIKGAGGILFSCRPAKCRMHR